VFPAFVGTHARTGQPYWGPANSDRPSGTKQPLSPQNHIVVPVSNDAAAVRVWARTGCRTEPDGKFRCEIGDCGNPLNNWDGSCYRGSGEGGISLAEFTFHRNTFYDLSLVDGYTLPISIKLYGNPQKSPGVPNEFNCGNPTCFPKQDFSQCPPELKKYNRQGQVIGCWNIHAAAADAEMRRGPHGQYLSFIWNDPDTWSRTACDALVGNCGGQNIQETYYSGNHLKRGNRLAREGGDRTGYACSPYIDWIAARKDLFEPFICYDEKKPKPLNGFGGGKSYSEIFKSICPLAYSWQFNDGESTFQCTGDDITYVVEFC
jgi:hypothetical protein